MFNALIHYPCFNCAGDYLGNEKLHVFPLTLPTLIFCAYHKVLLTIFEQAQETN